MIQQFQNLSTEEIEKMINAIPLITVLIAGADGNIDKEEKEWGAKITKIRTYSNPDVLHDFYTQVGRNFKGRLDSFIDTLPKDTNSRNLKISDELSSLNDIFPKLEIHFAAELYNSFTSFAKHVAKASGGFLGFGSISKEEKKFIGLPMLTPIIAPEIEGEAGDEEFKEWSDEDA